jgi:biopolymer transport protein ExbB
MNSLTAAASLAVLTALLPTAAHAWWNGDYKQRTRITLNTSAAGVETKESLGGVAVPVRLHSGNFDFVSAKPDGADLRFVAGDDKTPLKFWVERFDSTNELALVWVQVPTVVPGSDKNTIYAYAGNDTAVAEPAAEVFDSNTLAAFHFSEKDGPAADGSGALKTSAAVTREKNGLLASSLKLAGQAVIWPASDKLKAAGSGPLTISLWARPDAAAAGTVYSQGSLRINVDGGKLNAALGNVKLAGGDLAPTAWTHIVLTVGNGKVTLYANGAQSAQADVPVVEASNGLPSVMGEVSVGEGFTGQIDELEVAATVRSADWVKFTHAAQSADAKLVASKGESADSADSGEGDSGYMGILIKSLTPDAKAVIAILAVMFAIAVYVMVTKALFVGRTDRDNRSFLGRFRSAKDDLLHLEKGGSHVNSSLFRLYQAGVRELVKRDVGTGQSVLSSASLDAVKAAIDADMVRETHQLNSKMVLLTIAISGGPFLGLLGTVVGVMITFAAIAAAGDVNVNAIAPGIAAALLATVAGLSVAIPSLFGYNYLASRIKNISADMQIFVDEFVTRVAETYGSR